MKRECSVRLVDFGSVKALVSIKYGDLSIRGFRIIDQDGGKPWVAMPSREFQQNGERQYFNVVLIEEAEKRKEFNDWILDEFNRAIAN